MKTKTGKKSGGGHGSGRGAGRDPAAARRKQKQAPIGTQELDEKFRLLAETSPGMVFINRLGRVVYANSACARILGYTLEEFYTPGFSFISLIAPDCRDAVQSNYRKHLAGQEVRPLEYALLTKDGRRVEGVLTTSLITCEGEKSILGIVTDVTGMRRTEEALRESEALYRSLVETSPNAILLVDLGGSILMVNQQMALMWGGEEHGSDLVGKLPFLELLAPEDRERAMADILRVIKDGAIRNEEYTLLRADGSRYRAEISGSLITDLEGNPKAVLVVAVDITERKNTEEELLKARKLESMGILAGGIAHDFNNILTAILGNISMAKVHATGMDTIYERLVEAEKASLLARNLTQKLLTFARGGEPLRRTVSISQLLEDSILLSLSGSNVLCELYVPPDLWPVLVDRDQMNQVLNNLFINAKQAMPAGGTILIRAENVSLEAQQGLPLKEGKYVKLSVTDEGEGIPAKNLARIFDPYFSTRSDGSGLGLATTYSIIRKHGGHIFVESRVGAGTTFTIYLPASGEAPVPDEKALKQSLEPGRGKILVMDDQAVVRKAVESMLRLIGYQVVLAADGEEMIELYRKARQSGDLFDAVILDLTVPGGTGGREAVRRLLQIDPDAKAIASSGYSNDPVLAGFRIYGFSGVISKPYSIEQLGATLRNVLAGDPEKGEA